jgi:hypothetical protein
MRGAPGCGSPCLLLFGDRALVRVAPAQLVQICLTGSHPVLSQLGFGEPVSGHGMTVSSSRFLEQPELPTRTTKPPTSEYPPRVSRGHGLILSIQAPQRLPAAQNAVATLKTRLRPKGRVRRGALDSVWRRRQFSGRFAGKPYITGGNACGPAATLR